MNEVDLEKKKLQRAILMIAKDAIALCEKYNIKYFINSGTQLGAIRHKGFIPWDDDFDIGMKRLDYEKFINICKNELDPEKYFVQTEYTEPYYAFAFGKIQLKDTCILEDFSKNVPIQHGIFIDIFPYDNIPDNSVKRTFFLLINQILKNLLWIKCGYGEEIHKKQFSYKFLSVIAYMFSVEKLKEIRRNLLNQYNNIRTDKCISSDYPKERLDNRWFANLVKYKFEDAEFFGFKDCDNYLKCLYGDFMKIPSKSERVTHTNSEIDFGPYDQILEDEINGNFDKNKDDSM